MLYTPRFEIAAWLSRRSAGCAAATTV